MHLGHTPSTAMNLGTPTSLDRTVLHATTEQSSGLVRLRFFSDGPWPRSWRGDVLTGVRGFDPFPPLLEFKAA